MDSTKGATMPYICGNLCPGGFACCYSKPHKDHRCDLKGCCNAQKGA